MVVLELVSDTLTPELERLYRSLIDCAPAMRTIANVLDRGVKRNFREEGRPQHWRPLAESTQKAYVTGTKVGRGKARAKGSARRGGAHILRDTGRLIQSIQTRSGTFYAEIGTTLEYGAYHQFGSKMRTDQPPRRTFIGRSDVDSSSGLFLVAEDERDVIRAIDFHVTGQRGGEATAFLGFQG